MQQRTVGQMIEYLQQFDKDAPCKFQNETCGSCKHWKETQPHESDHVHGFGTCQNAQQLHAYDQKQAERNLLFGVVDGSDYFAALKTRENFACNQWEAKD